jgi:hypothetical protein
MRRQKSEAQSGKMFTDFLGNKSQRLQGMELKKELPKEKQEACLHRRSCSRR